MLNVLPTLSSHDIPSVLLGNVEPRPELVHTQPASSERSNLQYLSLGENAHSVLHAFRGATPSLAIHVGGVFALRAQRQMRRIAARWIVAGMKNVFAFWNWSVGKLPRQSVSVQKFFMPSDLTVAFRCFTRPRPAFFLRSLRNMLEEPFRPRCVPSCLMVGGCAHAESMPVVT